MFNIHEKCIVILLLLFIAGTALGAQGVDTSELKAVVKNPETFSFVNYTGPHAVVSTAAQIRGIGTALAVSVADNAGISLESGSASRYQVLHVVDSSETGKLDADILILGKDAAVDHIKNLRRIISGFLSDAYGYSQNDADTLAVFITVYNAVNRGKYSAFEAKYKKKVMEKLSPAECGLAIHWEDWAGKTQIVVPLLSPVQGGLSTIDTSIISTKDVISSLREESDRGVDDRKSLVDIKEREAEAAYDDAKKAQISSVKAAEEATKAEAEAELAEMALAAAREEERLAAEEAEEASQKALLDPDNEEARMDALEALEKSLTASEYADALQKDFENAESRALEAREESKAKSEQAAESQKFADRKNAETQNERIAIAQDQQKNIQDAAAFGKITTTVALLYDAGSDTSSLVLVNSDTGKLIKSSSITDIRSCSLYPIEGGYVTVAGRNDHINSAIKLVIIDEDSLEIIAQSHETLSEYAQLQEYQGLYYAVVTEGSKSYIGCFREDMTLVAKSTVEVLTKAPVVIINQTVAVTSTSGTVILLTSDTLEEIK